MTEQLTLAGDVDDPEVQLTARQRHALDYIERHGPVPSDELGALLHEHRPATAATIPARPHGRRGSRNAREQGCNPAEGASRAAPGPERHVIDLTVHGEPIPQGSKTRTRWGVREDNPRTKPWRAAVAAEAAAVMDGRPLLTGPLTLEVIFVFPRPQSHTGTGRNAGVLKRSAPIYQSTRPDLDKLLRACGDAMTGIVYRDDAQIARVTATKVYGEPARARILVTTIDAPPPLIEGQAA